MKKMLIEKLDSFAAAPFTIQRISELLSDPRKQYSRIDKFMRAVEKTILVVSTVPPGRHRSESENGDSLDSTGGALNGDFASEVNVDIDMEQDGAFAVTKDTSVVTVLRKEQNNEVSTANHETITIKKTVTEEEAGTSEKVEEKESAKASTAVTVESVATAVIEATKVEAAPENPITEKSEVIAAETSVIQETVPAEKVIEAPEPKVDDVLSNEPIRSAENEILVDTAEIISETTPLAALENIVAIRTEPVVEVAEPVVPVIAEPVTEAPTATEEDSETEAKRLKIEEVPEIATEPPFVIQEIAATSAEVPVEPLIPELVEKPATEKVEAPVIVVAEPSVIQEQTATIPQAENVVEVITPEKIDEPQPAIAEIPLDVVPPTQDIAETSATEMETVSTITENTMSLDEDEPPALEQEMTPITSKMDTDDVEAAPMDFEDDAEPMDQ
jgi:serine/threonine-protein phosphatase 4 regulatory subunit 2